MTSLLWLCLVLFGSQNQKKNPERDEFLLYLISQKMLAALLYVQVKLLAFFLVRIIWILCSIDLWFLYILFTILITIKTTWLGFSFVLLFQVKLKEFFSVNKKRETKEEDFLRETLAFCWREWENYVFLMDEVGGKEEIYMFFLIGKNTTKKYINPIIAICKRCWNCFVFDVWMQISPWEKVEQLIEEML